MLQVLAVRGKVRHGDPEVPQPESHTPPPPPHQTAGLGTAWTPFCQPELRGSGSPQSPWAWGKGPKEDGLIGVELNVLIPDFHLPPMTMPSVSHSASTPLCLGGGEGFQSFLGNCQHPPWERETPKLLTPHASHGDSLAHTTRRSGQGTGPKPRTGEKGPEKVGISSLHSSQCPNQCMHIMKF